MYMGVVIYCNCGVISFIIIIIIIWDFIIKMIYDFHLFDSWD